MKFQEPVIDCGTCDKSRDKPACKPGDLESEVYRNNLDKYSCEVVAENAQLDDP